MMRRWMGIVSGLVLTVCAMGAVGRPVSAATYTDPDGRFTFLAPEGYTQRYRAGTDISYRSLTAATTTVDVTVVAQSPDLLPTPDAFAANVLNTLKPPAYVGASAPEPVVLGGQPGRRFDYYTVLEGSAMRLHTLHIIAVSSRFAVMLVFAAPEAEYDRMVNDTALMPLSFSFNRTPGIVGSSTAGGSAAAGSMTAGSTVASTPSPSPPLTVAATETAPATSAEGVSAPVAPTPFSFSPAAAPPAAVPLAPPPALVPGPLSGVPVASSAPPGGVRRLGEG